MPPFLSIIVITKNNVETIEECIASLLDQTYPRDNYEIIFVDGHSNDGTDEVIKKCARENASAKLFYEDYGRMGYARNLGISKSKGDIVAFTDGDAILPTDWLERIVNHFSDDKLVALGGFDALPTSTESGRIIDSWRRLRKSVGVKAIPCIKTVNFAARREALSSCGGFDPDLSHWDEAELLARLAMTKIGDILYDPEIAVRHVRSRSSTLGARIKRVFRKSVNGVSVLTRRHMIKVAVANPVSNLATSFFMIPAVVVGVAILLFSVASGLFVDVLKFGFLFYIIVLSFYVVEVFRRTRRVNLRIPWLLSIDGAVQFVGTLFGLIRWGLQSATPTRREQKSMTDGH